MMTMPLSALASPNVPSASPVKPRATPTRKLTASPAQPVRDAACPVASALALRRTRLLPKPCPRAHRREPFFATQSVAKTTPKSLMSSSKKAKKTPASQAEKLQSRRVSFGMLEKMAVPERSVRYAMPTPIARRSPKVMSVQVCAATIATTTISTSTTSNPAAAARRWRRHSPSATLCPRGRVRFRPARERAPAH